MQYTIKEDKKGVEGQNEFDSLIEITGLSSTVTVNSLLDHYENTKKALKQQLGQVEANKALMEKAIEDFPMIKEIPEDKMGVVFSYLSKYIANAQSVDVIKTCEETISTYETHLRNIEKQTGIKCLPVVSPIQNGK